jgi:hypothetical protein
VVLFGAAAERVHVSMGARDGDLISLNVSKASNSRRVAKLTVIEEQQTASPLVL